MKHSEQSEEKDIKENAQKARSKKSIYMIIGVLFFIVAIVLLSIIIDRKIKQPGEDISEDEMIAENTSLTAYGQISQEELIEHIKKSIVRIEVKVPDGAGGENTMVGSGVIIDITDDYVDIVTARHVVEQTAKPLVYFNGGSSVYGIVLAYGKESDVAFVRVETGVLDEGIHESISKVKWVDNDAYEALSLGEEVVLIGSVSEVAGSIQYGTLKEKEKFVELFQNHMLVCEASVAGGMSGGGTFSLDGKLIGIIVGTNGTDTVNVAITDVMSEYRSISY